MLCVDLCRSAVFSLSDIFAASRMLEFWHLLRAVCYLRHWWLYSSSYFTWMANDGVMMMEPDGGSMTHSIGTLNSYLLIDLGGMCNITRFIFWNRRSAGRPCPGTTSS